MVTFQQAYEAAAARYAPEDWLHLRPDLRINAIYEEMRRLDAEAAGVKVASHPIEEVASLSRSNRNGYKSDAGDGRTGGAWQQ
jgi:hypothetical protein